MTKPKANWNSFTKAELIKTIKKLDARQTKLLNEIAALKNVPVECKLERATVQPPSELPNPFDDTNDAIAAEQEERQRIFGPFPWAPE